jgi:hypothetical protein
MATRRRRPAPRKVKKNRPANAIAYMVLFLGL